MNVKGGRFINKGMKGVVYEIRDLIKDFNFGIEEIVLMGINDNGKSKKIVLRDDNEILWIIKELKKVNERNEILVKKFMGSSIFSGFDENNFKNEFNGYKKIISIFGKNVDKFTTIREGFVYKGVKIYGISFESNYYIFMERCDRTIDKIPFTQEKFDKFSKQIFKVLEVLNKNNYIHNDIKPSNLIECNGNFKVIDWELSYDFKKQSKGFYLNNFGNAVYNHPIKFYKNGIPLFINSIMYHFQINFYEKNLKKLKKPAIIRKLIFETFDKLNKDFRYYLKYSDFFAFALVHIYMAEKNNLKINIKIINDILRKFKIDIKITHL